jgi:Rod binding domain-containing protein
MMNASSSLPFSLSPATPAALVRSGSPLLDATAGAAPLAARQESFAAVLARAGTRGAKAPAAAAREAAEQIVSVTLVQPLLMRLRESNMAAPPLAPSRGERQFQSLMDAHVAQEVVKAANFPLVDELARRLLRDATPAAAPAQEAAA